MFSYTNISLISLKFWDEDDAFEEEEDNKCPVIDNLQPLLKWMAEKQLGSSKRNKCCMTLLVGHSHGGGRCDLILISIFLFYGW